MRVRNELYHTCSKLTIRMGCVYSYVQHLKLSNIRQQGFHNLSNQFFILILQMSTYAQATYQFLDSPILFVFTYIKNLMENLTRVIIVLFIIFTTNLLLLLVYLSISNTLCGTLEWFASSYLYHQNSRTYFNPNHIAWPFNNETFTF